MSSLLEEMWRHAAYPIDFNPYARPEAVDLLEFIKRTRDKMLNALDENTKKDLMKYDEYTSDLRRFVEREVFIHAFKLGGKIMAETLRE